MEVLAFVGPSGTGKSHLVLDVARNNGADAIIDDGLLIHQGQIVCGVSAKGEAHTIRAVRRAIFTDAEHAASVQECLGRVAPQRLLLVGTSDRMVGLIAEALGLPPPQRTIYIQDVSDDATMAAARKSPARRQACGAGAGQ